MDEGFVVMYSLGFWLRVVWAVQAKLSPAQGAEVLCKDASGAVQA